MFTFKTSLEIQSEVLHRDGFLGETDPGAASGLALQVTT